MGRAHEGRTFAQVVGLLTTMPFSGGHRRAECPDAVLASCLSKPLMASGEITMELGQGNR